MADIKLSNLPAKGAPSALVDLFETTTGGETKSVTGANIVHMVGQDNLGSVVNAEDARANINALSSVAGSVEETHLSAAVQDKLNNTSPSNLVATAPPAATDDAPEYTVGSMWIDTVANEAYRCVEAPGTGNAVWISTTLDTSELGTMATQNDNAVNITGGTAEFSTLVSENIAVANAQPTYSLQTATGATTAFIRKVTDLMQLRNVSPGGSFNLQGTDTGGTVRNILLGDPDGGVELHRRGVRAIQTQVNGANIYSTTGNVPQLQFFSSANVLTGFINAATGGMNITSAPAGQPILLRARNNSSSSTTVFSGDPDGAAQLYHAGILRLSTFASGVNIPAPPGSIAGTNLNAAGLVIGSTTNGLGLDTNEVVAAGSNLILGSTTGSVALNYAGLNRALETTPMGALISPMNDTDTFFVLRSQGNQDRARFTASDTQTFIRSLNHGGDLILQGEDQNGTLRNMFFANPDGAAQLLYGGNNSLETDAFGISVSSPSSGDTRVVLQSSGGTDRGLFVCSDTAFVLRSLNHGGTVFVQGEDNGGTSRNILVGDPNGAANLYFDGVRTLSTSINGTDVLDTNGNVPIIGMRTSAGILNGRLISDSVSMRMINSVTSGPIELQATDSGGTVRNTFLASPDSAANLFYAGIKAVATQEIGLQVHSTTGATSQIQFFDNNTVSRGTINMSSTNMDFRVFSAGAISRTLGTRTSDSATVTMASFDPDGATTLSFAGSSTFETIGSGIAVRDRDGDTLFPTISMLSGAGVSQGFIQFGNTGARLQSQAHGGTVSLQGEDNGGVARDILVGDPDGSTELYRRGIRTLQTQENGINVYGATSNICQVQFVDSSNSTNGFITMSDTGVTIRSLRHGQPINIQGEDNGGVLNNVLTADPDGSTQLYNAGSPALSTDSIGITARSTGGGSPRIQLQTGDFTTRGFIQARSDSLRIDSRVNGSPIILQGLDASGNDQTMVNADPDGAAILYHSGSSTFETRGDGIGVRDSNGNLAFPTITMLTGAGVTNGIIEFGNAGYRLQGRVNGGTAAIQANDNGGVARNILFGDPDGSAQLFHIGQSVLNTHSAGITLNGSSPLLRFGDRASFLAGSSDFVVRNAVNGGKILLTADNSSGTIRNIFQGDPNGGSGMYHAGLRVLDTATNGARILDQDGDTLTPVLTFATGAGAVQGTVQFGNTGTTITNSVHGTPISLVSEDNSGTARNILVGDPDGSASLYNSGVIRLTTLVNGVQVESDAEQSILSVNNSGTGDSAIRYRTAGISKAISGVDVGDGDKFKISPANFGSSDMLILNPSDLSAEFGGVVKAGGVVSSQYGSARPATATLDPGSRFFDTTINRAIYVNSTQDGWIVPPTTSFFDTADTATTVTPISHVGHLTNTTQLTNNGLGAFSHSYSPGSLIDPWDSSTNAFDFTDLNINDLVQVRLDIVVDTDSANQEFDIVAKFGIGSASEFTLNIYHAGFKDSGPHSVTITFPFYIGNADVRDNPAEFHIQSSQSADVVVNGWFTEVKQIN